MKFQVVTLFPEMIEAAAATGVVGQACRKGLLEVTTIQPRDFAVGVHHAVDDRPFGGGDGMIMMPEILEACVARARSQGATRVIYMSPQGAPLTDARTRALAGEGNLTLICGRYGGVDQRALNLCVDEEISIGDYVLSGGELAALVVIDAVGRLVPGVLGHGESARQDSFADGLLEFPNFTRPREWRGQAVPEALLSGHHGKIEAWKRQLSILVTAKKRPDLLSVLTRAERGAAFKMWETLSPTERAACGLDDVDLRPVLLPDEF